MVFRPDGPRDVLHVDMQWSECAVCYAQIDDADSESLRCGHGFHHSCLQTWLAENPSCPLCRDDATERVVLSCEECRDQFAVSEYGDLGRVREALAQHLRRAHGIVKASTGELNPEAAPFVSNPARVLAFGPTVFDHLQGFERARMQLMLRVLQSQVAEADNSTENQGSTYVCEVCEKSFSPKG